MKIKLLLIICIMSIVSCEKAEQKNAKNNNLDTDKKTLSFNEAIILTQSSFGSHLSTNTSSGSVRQTTLNNTLIVKNLPDEVPYNGICYLNYPFKKGSSYSLRVTYTPTAQEVVGDVKRSLERMPSLQFQHSRTEWTTCASEDINRYLTGGTVFDLPNPVVMGTSKEFTYNFTPDDCSDYIIINARPNLQGRSKGYMQVRTVVTETRMLEIVGENTININEESTYATTVGGFPINTSFKWRVTGDLQIVGPNVGPSANIKATSNNGGTIFLDSNDSDGCIGMSSKDISPSTIDIPRIQSPPGTLYVNTAYSFAVGNTEPSVLNYTWSVVGGTIISGQGTNNVSISFNDFAGTISKNATITVVANGLYENRSSQITKSINKCNNCPIN